METINLILSQRKRALFIFTLVVVSALSLTMYVGRLRFTTTTIGTIDKGVSEKNIFRTLTAINKTSSTANSGRVSKLHLTASSSYYHTKNTFSNIDGKAQPLQDSRSTHKPDSDVFWMDSRTGQNFTIPTAKSRDEYKQNRDDGEYVKSIKNESTQLCSTTNCKVTCNPVTDIVFIKCHKTGSTTTASIFQRFGYRRNLLFALPKTTKKLIHIFSLSKLFSRDMIKPWPVELAKRHPYYNMIVNHAIYNRPELSKVVRKNATYITILRDPVLQLESAFGYFEMAKGLGLSNTSNPFEEFMNNSLLFYTTKNYFMKQQSRNGQLFDLGFNPELADDKNAIRLKINDLEKEFNLVMITDYFDESLILLKKLLCWSFDDILYITHGIRSQSHRYNVTDDLKNEIRRWNAGDVLLYNHFNETFWRKVKEYGPDFQRDLEKFKRLERESFDKCVDTQMYGVKDGRVVKYKIKTQNTGNYCADLYRSDVPYTALLRKKMYNICEPYLHGIPYDMFWKDSSKKFSADPAIVLALFLVATRVLCVGP